MRIFEDSSGKPFNLRLGRKGLGTSVFCKLRLTKNLKKSQKLLGLENFRILVIAFVKTQRVIRGLALNIDKIFIFFSFRFTIGRVFLDNHQDLFLDSFSELLDTNRFKFIFKLPLCINLLFNNRAGSLIEALFFALRIFL